MATRSSVVAINVICWFLGVLFVIGVGWVLDQLLADGVVKSLLEWVVVGVAVLLFGGVPWALTKSQSDGVSK